MLFGDDFGTHGLLNPAELRDLIQNWPGGMELAPSRLYWEFYDGSSSARPVPFRENRDFDGDGQVLGSLNYDQTASLLDNVGTNMTVFGMAETFHDDLDTSWDAALPVPEVHIVAGTNICTPGQLRAYNRRIGRTGQGIRPVVDLLHVNGDGTVPLFSATLEDTTRGLDHNSNARVYYVVGAEHGNVPIQDNILQLVANILQGDATVPQGISQSQRGSCSGKVVSVESPVELHIYDSAGNHTGLTPLPGAPNAQPFVEESILGSTYEELLESKFVYLPQEGMYTIRLKATGEGTFNLRLRSYEDDQIINTILYLRALLTSTTFGQMRYDTTSAEPPLLLLDHDGDGVFDQTLTATSVLGIAESADVQAPVIEIQSPTDGSTVRGKTHLAWTVADDLSGVLTEIAEIDGGTASAQSAVNRSDVFLAPGSHTLTVIAEDRLGNAAVKISTFTVMGPCNLPALTALLDDLRANGLITQRGVYESLRQKLVEAQKELDRGKTDKAAKKVWDLVEQLDKEAGKGRIALVGAALLQDGAFCILGTLGKDETSLRAIEGLRDLVAADYQQGLIASASLRDKLDERLSKGQEKLVDEGARNAADELTKFIADVTKERGKKINAAAADELIAQAQSIMARLNAAGGRP